MKNGRTIIRAGTYAYICLCLSSVRKAYDLTDSLGSVLAVRDITFLTEFASPDQRETRANQALRLYRTELESVQHAHRHQRRQWADDRKEWELELVFRVWDERLRKFPPYVTERHHLGDIAMSIPHEYKEKPAFQSNYYYAICLEPMPLICHICQHNIDKQQFIAQADLAAVEAN